MYERIREWNFEGKHGRLFRQIFSGREARRSSFRNSNWKFALIYRSLRWNRPEFETICQAASFVGDSDMVVTSLQSEPQHRWTCRIQCDHKSLVEALGDDDLCWLAAVNKAFFGLSGKWGLLVDECVTMPIGYALIGGEEPFMDTLIQSRGGQSKMKEDFLMLLNDPLLASAPYSELGKSLLSEVGWK